MQNVLSTKSVLGTYIVSGMGDYIAGKDWNKTAEVTKNAPQNDHNNGRHAAKWT